MFSFSFSEVSDADSSRTTPLRSKSVEEVLKTANVNQSCDNDIIFMARAFLTSSDVIDVELNHYK